MRATRHHPRRLLRLLVPLTCALLGPAAASALEVTARVEPSVVEAAYGETLQETVSLGVQIDERQTYPVRHEFRALLPSELRRFVRLLPDPVAVTVDPGQLSGSAGIRLDVDAGAPAGEHRIELLSDGPRASLVLVIERREPDEGRGGEPSLTVEPRRLKLVAGTESRPLAIRVEKMPAGERLTFSLDGLPEGVSADPPRPALRLDGRETAGRVDFRLAARLDAGPGRYTITVEEAGRRLRASVELIVERPPGRLGVEAGERSFAVCPGETARTAVDFVPLDGYRGQPRLRWKEISPGLEVTPRPPSIEGLPPRQRLPIALRALPGSAGSRQRAVLEHTDPVRGETGEIVFRVDAGAAGWTPRLSPARIELRQGAPAEAVGLSLVTEPCFRESQLRFEVGELPQGLEVSPTSGVLQAPRFAAELSLRAGPEAALGVHSVPIVVGGADRDERLELIVRIDLPGPGEIVRTPRVDRIEPYRVAPGDRYELTLHGRNLAPDVELSFEGRDIRVLGPMRVRSAERAAVTVEVLPGARPGVRAARVASGVGASEGPGGLLVERRRPAPEAGAASEPTEISPPRREPPPRSTGPRVDSVLPERLRPGLTHTVTLRGKNFSPSMKLEFGPDVRPVNPPRLRGPWHAVLEIAVDREAAWGFREVNASDGRGANQGPGRIEIAGNLEDEPRGPSLTEPTTFIELLNPRGANEPDCSGAGCAPAGLDDDTLFNWREANPGTSDHFAVEFVDAEGEVVASAQTQEVFYLMRSVVLSQLLAAAPATGEPSWQARETPDEAVMAVAGLGQTFDTGWQEDDSTLWWRVRAYWNDPESGQPEEIGVSETRPLVLPDPAVGLGDCSAAPGGSQLLWAEEGPIPGVEQPPVCAAGDVICVDSRLGLSGVIDASKSPYDLGLETDGLVGNLTFNPGTAQWPVTFRNVWIDWGDGTAPEMLRVRVSAAGDPSAIQLIGPDGGPIRHDYRAAGEFTAKVYALAEPEEDLQMVLAYAAQTQAAAAVAPWQSLAAGPTTSAAVATSPAATQAFAATPPDLSDAYLMGCRPVSVQPMTNAGLDGPLHLLDVEVVWPGAYAAFDEPEVSECAESFRPELRLTYFGHGRVKVSWYGGALQPMETYTSQVLPAVSIPEAEAGLSPWVHSMSLSPPLFASDQPYPIRVVVEDADTASDLGLVLDTSGPPPPIGTVYAVQTTPPPTTTPTPAPTYSAAPRPTEVASESRSYRVVPAAEGQPCRLVYETAETGTHLLTDVVVEDPDPEQLSGTATLKLPFPDGAGGIAYRYAPVEFDDWQVEAGETGGDWPVVAGELSAAPGMSFEAASFEISLDAVELNLEELTITGFVGLTPAQGLGGVGAHLPDFPFADARLHAESGFYTAVAGGGEIGIGSSGFALGLGNAVLDFSTTQGSPYATGSTAYQGPVQLVGGEAPPVGTTIPAGCQISPSGAAWAGIMIADGELLMPSFDLVGQTIGLGEIDFADWPIGPSGLSAEKGLQVQQSFQVGSVGLHFTGMDFTFCEGVFDIQLGVKFQNLPIFAYGQPGLELPFNLLFDLNGLQEAHFPFDIDLNLDFGLLELTIEDVSLTDDAELGEWVFSTDGWLELKLDSSTTVYTQYIQNLRIALDGRIYPPAGLGSWFPAGESIGNLADFPIEVSEMGMGFANNLVWFGLSGGIDLGGVLSLQAANLTFNLEPDGLGLVPAGVSVQQISFEAGFPPGAPAAEIEASVGWQDDGGNRRFSGSGSLGIQGSLGFGADFLFGRDGGDSYWVAQAGFELPLGGAIPLGALPLGIYGFSGGLGYNVGLDAFQIPVHQVQPDPGSGLSLTAGMSVATLDGGYTTWIDGALSIGFGGPDAGARVDGDGWMVTHQRNHPAPLQACMRATGSGFTAAAGVDMEMLGGQVRLTAPFTGDDPCTDPESAINISFFPDSWQIHIGTAANPVGLEAFGSQATGYLSLDPSGFSLGGTIGRQFGPYQIGLGNTYLFAGGQFNWGFGFGLEVNPLHIYGSGHADASLDVGGCILGACASWNPGFNLDLHAEATNPTELCIDELRLYGLPFWGDVTVAEDKCLSI